MATAVARFFDEMAGAYDVLEPWYEHLYATLHALLRAELRPEGSRARPRALDAGCGTGFQAALLEELGYATHGADLSAGLLEIARGRLRAAPLARADLRALPYADGVFDTVTCCGSALSLLARPGAALREMGRVLRPGGRLLLECEGRWSLDLGWALLSSVAGDALGYGLSPGAAWRQLAPPLRRGRWVRYPGYGRLRLFTRSELRALLAAAGLVPERAWGIHAVTNVIPSTVLHRTRLGGPVARLYRALCRLDRALGAFAPARSLANSVVVLARKEEGAAGDRGRGPRRALPRPG